MKYGIFWRLSLGILLMAACHDEEETPVPVNTLPPGTEYMKQGDYCLNVVYYIPKGGDTLSGWHKIISSVILQEQTLFKEQMTAAGYEGQTFHLCINKQNPAYVDVNLVQGRIDSVGKYKDYGAIGVEVEGYFAQNPEKRLSAHTMIFAPEVKFSKFWYITETEKTLGGNALWGNDLSGGTLSAEVQGDLAQWMGMMFFLPATGEPVQDIYYSLMNPLNTGYWYKGAVRLKRPDAMWLSLNQVFGDNGSVDYAQKPKVTVEHTDFKYENECIQVNCEFTSEENIVGVIVYNNPWNEEKREDDILDNNNYSLYDAIPYLTEQVNKNGSNYRIEMAIPWNDLPATSKVPEKDENYAVAEIHFRFLVEDGRALPIGYSFKGSIDSGLRYPYAIKNYIPDFSVKVDTDIKEQDNKSE